MTFKQSIKFFGTMFDHRLTWNEHIKQTRTKCVKKISILKILSHPSTGFDQKTFLSIYRTLVRPYLDYGSHRLIHVNKTSLAMLDLIYTFAIRIFTGAFRTTSSPSLFCESSELPLYIRRIRLTSNFLCNTYLNLNTQIYKLLFGRIWRSFHFSPSTKNIFLISYLSPAPYLCHSFLFTP